MKSSINCNMIPIIIKYIQTAIATIMHDPKILLYLGFTKNFLSVCNVLTL